MQQGPTGWTIEPKGCRPVAWSGEGLLTAAEKVAVGWAWQGGIPRTPGPARLMQADTGSLVQAR